MEVLPRAGDVRELPEHAAFLRGLVHGMRCGIVAVDRAGRLMMINRVAREILELTREPRPGLPVREALSAYPHLARLLYDSFTMSNLPNRAELDLRPGGAEGKTIGFTMSLVPGTDGTAVGAAVFFKDLTQIEHKEEQERLKDRLAALGEMAASLAHEIRNPLAAIEVSCSLLKRRLGSVSAATEKHQELLSKIAAEVRRLNRTVTSSLEFVRPLALTLDRSEVCPMLDEAIAVARGRCDKPGIDIVRAYAPDVPPFLMDRGQLRQVFENLILNAMEAMGDQGCVRVEVEMRPAPGFDTVPYVVEGAARDPWQRFEHFAVIRVADSGPGIGEDERSRIFFPFFTTKKQGSGVGLSMAKKIINSHRGMIDVDDAPDGGARFTVRLPMVLETAEA